MGGYKIFVNAKVNKKVPFFVCFLNRISMCQMYFMSYKVFLLKTKDFWGNKSVTVHYTKNKQSGFYTWISKYLYNEQNECVFLQKVSVKSLKRFFTSIDTTKGIFSCKVNLIIPKITAVACTDN